ncbi:DUF895 domain membrane protein [Chytriomyces hyalinus]|nr:DUF895 domain membrane protein [Chytriomyces hyalinus]
MYLDNTKYTRTTRAWTGFYLIAGSTIIFFGGGAAFEYAASAPGFIPIDAGKETGRFLGPFLLYVCYGIYDAWFQIYTNYLIGAISNDSETLSRYAGFYKGTQSAGGGISWALNGFVFTAKNGNKLTSTAQFWVMVVPCLVSIAFFGIYCKTFVKDFTDESAETGVSAMKAH